MKIIKDAAPISKIIADNPGKIIGKYNINCDKITNTKFNLHACHLDGIQQLRLSVDIIILEFWDFNNIYKSLEHLKRPSILVPDNAILNLVDKVMFCQFLLMILCLRRVFMNNNEENKDQKIFLILIFNL